MRTAGSVRILSLRRHLPITVIALLGIAARPAAGQIVLNEFMANNVSTITDEMGEYEDWIEVLNTGAAPVDLTGMFLTDDLLVTNRWPIPTIILGPGERVLFWADAEVTEGARHTNFRLETNGEALGLFDTIANGNNAIDTVVFGEQAADASYGRFPDGSGGWIYMATPTPNAANVDQGNIAPLISDTHHTPSSPAPDEPVTVTARIRDLDGSLNPNFTRLFYEAISTVMFDDGQHGDGAAGDQIYGAQIPGYPGNTTVHYYVGARDTEFAQTYDPVGAPGVTYSYVVGFVPPQVALNEFMAANTTTFADEFGEFDDWVEITNWGTQPVDLGGLNLSDDFAVPNRYTFPSVILNPNQFQIIWCDGTPVQGPFHANFRLSATGEALGLFASSANGFAVIDSLTFGLQTVNVSMARRPDGTGSWIFDTSPTPGLSNTLPDAVEQTTWSAIKRMFRR